MVVVSGEKWVGKWERRRNCWLREGILKVYFFMELVLKRHQENDNNKNNPHSCARHCSKCFIHSF